jgi:hypothetical protein
LQPVVDPAATEWPLPNPSLESLQSRAGVQLAKLRQGRNIAGVQRAAGPAAPTTSPLPAQQTLPTPYRYRVLVERTRQLVTLAEQAEATYLAALEKYDNAAFRRFDANKGVELSEAAATLQGLRVTEATRGESLAQAQRDRASAVSNEYQHLIDAGLNQYENAMLDGYWNMRRLRNWSTALEATIAGGQAAEGAVAPWQWAIAGALSVQYVDRAIFSAAINLQQARLESNTLLASHERAVEGWQLQKNIADRDGLVADQQVLVAGDQKAIVEQEQRNAQIQAQISGTRLTRCLLT